MQRFDVVVIGATPGGIAAALAAARHGHTVALVEHHAHVGGMAASGLGKSDIEHPELIQGLFAEFVGLVREHYARAHGVDSDAYRLCRDGYYYEPSVAEAVLERMLGAEAGITVRRAVRLAGARVAGGRLVGASLVDRVTGEASELAAEVFVDATYEGDLYAAAGAAFRTGREGRDAHGEPHAGHIYFDYQRAVILPRSTHRGDNRLPAYTYRLCLTTDPANAAPLEGPPAGYERDTYLPYLDDLKAGRLAGPARVVEGRGYYPAHFDTPVRALSVTDIPNGKVDANINPRPLAFPFPEENEGYLEAGWQAREAIALRHRRLALGLIWFIQNDPAISAAHRRLAQGYHLPKDEFTDNGHFPFQLYVREGRRLRGCYTLTEHDVAETGTPAIRAGTRMRWPSVPSRSTAFRCRSASRATASCSRAISACSNRSRGPIRSRTGS
ncbi:MAG: FAD-dependent oxidoreductase [Geminicoccaceae bacterium]